jgi:S-adenosylmethionine synthetase
MTRETIFTSESVTTGHPDKLCDQISDAAIDAYLRHNSRAHAIVECAIATGVVFLAARFSAGSVVDLPSLARNVITDVGYVGTDFDARKCSILTSFSELPADTGRSWSEDPDDEELDRFEAHEQANVFGYACNDTPELMPLPISLAHELARSLDHARRTEMPWLAPDAKTQVAVIYAGSRPVRLHSISLTASVSIGIADAADRLRHVASATLASCNRAPFDTTSIHLNLDRHYDSAGPARHAGLTGRKNGIDTYGEIARQSGAALSGKDPSRIDRIGAYAARHAAKNIIAAGLADRCEVHVAYMIGQSRPLSVAVNTFNTGRIPEDDIAVRLNDVIDLRPAAIERRFALRTESARRGERGFYRPLSVYGHFGRKDLDLPWETTDLAGALRA